MQVYVYVLSVNYEATFKKVCFMSSGWAGGQNCGQSGRHIKKKFFFFFSCIEFFLRGGGGGREKVYFFQN